MAITASYQASFEGYAARGLDEAAAASILRLSVDLAREARDERTAVAGWRPRSGRTAR